MERTQTQVQNQNQAQNQTPIITYQHICYRVDTIEVVYCPDENRFCRPIKMHPEYIEYSVQPGKKYIALRYTNDVLSYCVDVELMETDEEGVIVEYEISRRICDSIDIARKVPRVMREIIHTVLSNYEYHCYLKSTLEILEHVLNELAKKQFSERDTKELLDWLSAQD